jgi:RNA polymerase sigma-70 factor (ECF subfamily)
MTMPGDPPVSPGEPALRAGPAVIADRCHRWYAAFGRAVYRYFRFHVDSADTADDLTADLFFHLLESADRYDPGRSDARVWVFSIARNALHDHYRRLKVRQHVTLGAVRDLAAEAPSPEERLVRQEEIALLLDGVRHLRAADRELIGLRYGSELSMGEIAEVLALRVATVRTRLWRALERLRAQLVSSGDA